ncbi:T9SS type A sorting domain-containing protein [Spirosoma validum]|uniref:T9SS type A sorting domain-containing protein n=1 Tax=Spirosoma validum TaxID=2771355 RepID=A0A927B410_9BACT|nr:T9SS type A sorting domain-containing protein [Spirosoma validum]MBD2755225.1 T9SS type A sorting domain-containing protein [Spirosoma validum]
MAHWLLMFRGGNGSRIEYSIPGIKSWSTNPNFTVPLWIRTDANNDPLILFARQSGVIVSYVFDSRSFCPEEPALLSLLTPTYNCVSGALTFNINGGNGSSTIEYMISGVTSWSKKSIVTVPVRFRANRDLLLLARQSGVTSSYVFELQDFCTGTTTSNSLTLLEPDYICITGGLTVHVSGGNGGLMEYSIPGVRSWSKNPNFTVPAGIRNDPNTQPLLLFVRQSGDIVSAVFDFREFCMPDQFQMLAPNYICQTGRLTVYTTAGIGSKIEYMLPGVRGYSTNPIFTISAAIRNNPASQPLVLFARQNGVEVSALFDFREFCRIGTFTVVAPVYNCTSGKLTMKTSGGNGTLMEYSIPGVRSWSKNPNFTVPAGIRNDRNSQQLNLLARQGGVLANYVFNFRAFCGSTARQGVEDATEPLEDLQLRVLGNPVKNEAVVEIRGAVGQFLTIRLFDQVGRLVTMQSIRQAEEIERVRFDVSRQQAGVLILHVMTARQAKAVRLIKL